MFTTVKQRGRPGTAHRHAAQVVEPEIKKADRAEPEGRNGKCETKGKFETNTGENESRMIIGSLLSISSYCALSNVNRNAKEEGAHLILVPTCDVPRTRFYESPPMHRARPGLELLAL